MTQQTNDTLISQKIVYDTNLPEGEVHMHPYTMALMEARMKTITTVHVPQVSAKP